VFWVGDVTGCMSLPVATNETMALLGQGPVKCKNVVYNKCL